MKTTTRFFINPRMRRVSSILAALFCFAALPAGSTTLELKSPWKDREISIDGKSDDWEGKLVYLEKENISLGLMNDGSCLYICFVAKDLPRQTQVMRQGLVIWFNPAGGKKKVFGLEFPLSIFERPSRSIPLGPEQTEQNQNNQEQLLQESFDEIKIIGPGKGMWEIKPIQEATGIGAAAKITGGVLVAELKIPLLQSELTPYAVGAKPGSAIGFGLEIPQPNAFAMSPGGSRSGAVGGRTGGMRGGTGEPGGQAAGRNVKLPKEIDLWANVRFSSMAPQNEN